MPTKSRIIRDAVHGVSAFDSGLFPILDTLELQRLRWIRQTGLVYIAYPGSEHSRFTHALGAYAVSDRVFDYLKRSSNEFAEWSPSKLTPELRRVFNAAALCHDLGHTAFSHLFEPSLLPEGIPTHEDCTLKLITEGPEIAEQLKNWCDRDQVVDLLRSKHWNLGLCSLLSGHVDVDRWDYLLRDAQGTGVRYGIFDLGWMIHSLSLRNLETGQPVIVLDGKRGPAALQQFLSARRYMYRQVYWHPTVLAAQWLLRAIFKRGLDPGRLGYENKRERELVAPVLRGVMFHRRRPTLGEFLDMDDAVLLSTVRRWAAESRDPLLRGMSSCFIRRKLPKAIDLGSNVLDDRQLDLVRSAVRDGLKSVGNIKYEIDDGALDYLVSQDTQELKGGTVGNLLVDLNGQVKRLEDAALDSIELKLVKDIDDGFRVSHLFVPEGTVEQVNQVLSAEGK